MNIKVFHLNTECNGITNIHETRKLGMLPNIVQYINKNKFDLVGFQEVANNYSFNPDRLDDAQNVDGYKYYYENLANLNGELFKISSLIEVGDSYYGIAAFYNPNKFRLISVDKVLMCKFDYKKSVYKNDPINSPYGFIVLELQDINSEIKFYFLTGHLTWGPVSYIDTAVQFERIKVLADYIKKLNKPRILTLDMNVEWFTKTAELLEKSGLISLAKKYKIKNTLNPKRTKYYKEIFIDDPKSSKKGGVAIDNILVSPEIKESKFEVVKGNLSDHYGLSASLELNKFRNI